MKDKRGQGISMEFIIIAAIALIVLIVIILFFTGGLEKIFGQQGQQIGTVTDQDKEIWRSQCKLYCSLGQRENFVNKEFKGKDDRIYKCKSGSGDTNLQVECGECTGNAPDDKPPCSQQKTETACKAITGCSWTNWS